MSDVDWFALWYEFAQAIDNKQLEVAERIVCIQWSLGFAKAREHDVECATVIRRS